VHVGIDRRRDRVGGQQVALEGSALRKGAALNAIQIAEVLCATRHG
jgi:hypothetical protein